LDKYFYELSSKAEKSPLQASKLKEYLAKIANAKYISENLLSTILQNSAIEVSSRLLPSPPGLLPDYTLLTKDREQYSKNKFRHYKKEYHCCMRISKMCMQKDRPSILSTASYIGTIKLPT
jgi:hypothetical protein